MAIIKNISIDFETENMLKEFNKIGINVSKEFREYVKKRYNQLLANGTVEGGNDGTKDVQLR